MSYKAYAGIGSRSTPKPILLLMQHVAHKLAQQGWTLRSGGAAGADAAFEEGCSFAHGKKEIYIPWQGFSDRRDGQEGAILVREPSVVATATAMAMSLHPAWDNCSRGARALHTRNMYQIMGREMIRSVRFVLYYAPEGIDGLPTGGTRTAVALAQASAIPTTNLLHKSSQERLEAWLCKT